MRESPSHALRACRALADVYQPLAHELFNAAFVSCWTELYDKYQEDLVRAIEAAFDAPDIPDQVVHMLLNLAEFMEHDEKPMPIDHRTLAALADRGVEGAIVGKALYNGNFTLPEALAITQVPRG